MIYWAIDLALVGRCYRKTYKISQELINQVALLIKTKRIYDPPTGDDCYRVLIDRLWPRGMSKEKAKLDLWIKEIAPTDELRTWFNHEPEKWVEFQKKYQKELSAKADFIDRLKQIEKEKSVITLVYAAKDNEHNNAKALKVVLETK